MKQPLPMTPTCLSGTAPHGKLIEMPRRRLATQPVSGECPRWLRALELSVLFGCVFGPWALMALALWALKEVAR